MMEKRMMLKRLAIATTLFSIACSDFVSPVEDTHSPRAPANGEVATEDFVLTHDGAVFAREMERLGGLTEVILWTKPTDLAPPRLSAFSRAESVIAVPEARAGRDARGSVVRTLSSGESRQAAVERIAALGGTVVAVGQEMPFVVVRLPRQRAAVVASALLLEPFVDWMEVNQSRRAGGIADPLGSNITDARHTYHHVNGAWDYSRGTGASVGVFDSGLVGNTTNGQWHRDALNLGSYGVAALGFVDDGGDCNVVEQALGLCLANDDNGHGTQMVGIVGANDNSLDRVGVSPLAEIYSVKIAFNADRLGLSCGLPPPIGGGDSVFCIEDDDFVKAFDWAMAVDLDVISMSFTGDPGISRSAALFYAYADDILILAGLGNDSDAKDGYVSHPAVMGIGGARTDSILEYTFNLQYMEAVGYSGGWTLKPLCSGITLCVWSASDPVQLTGGTSAATAAVAGVAALLRSQSPGLTASQVRARLQSTGSGINGLRVVDAEWALEDRTRVSVSIHGPSEILEAGDYTWTASASGGEGSGYTYVWEKRDSGPFSNWSVVGTGSSYLLGVPAEQGDFDLRMTVTNSGRRARNSFGVEVMIDCEEEEEGDGCNA